MKKYLVEFGFGENVIDVQEWDILDGSGIVDARSAEEAAIELSYTDGLEKALFRACQVVKNCFGDFEKSGTCEYFSFS